MPELLIEKHGRTTVLTLNRPEARNAITPSLTADLTLAVKEFNADPDQYVCIITGAGERAFCSGGDLGMMASDAGETSAFPVNEWPDLCGLAESEKPLIAAVNGVCVSGGFELALSCDIRIASESAWFGLFEVKWGVIAGVGVNILPRMVSMGVAMDLMLSADRLTAQDAWRLGLVQKLTTPDKLMEEALLKADMIAANSQPAVWGTKKVLKFWREVQLLEQQKYFEAVMQRVILSGDFLEGPKSFAEKRTPQFKNRWPRI